MLIAESKVLIFSVMVNTISAFSSVRYTSDQCVSACSNQQFANDATLCRKCSRNPPLTYQMCTFACDDLTGEPVLDRICQTCAKRAPPTSPMCVHACDSTFIGEYMEICLRCEENPPVTAIMCIHSCDRTAFSWYRSICEICSMDPPTGLCRHACQNTAFPKYKMICEKRVCSYSRTQK